MRKLELNNLQDICTEIMLIAEDKNIPFIEACILYCDEHDIEAETLGNIVKKNQTLKGKIKMEAEELNFIKKEAKLLFE